MVAPHTWMFPPLSNAMELYHRLTGNEDALDWVIAFGEAQAHLSFQPKHGNLSYRANWADFPVKGFFQAWASWQLGPGRSPPWWIPTTSPFCRTAIWPSG